LEQNTNAPGQEFNLASILNILWRRRLIVLGLPLLGLAVGLLYGAFGTKRWSATATVRPGITSFSPDGSPWRQWQLKDITTWFDKELYRQDLVERLELDPDFRPVIRTEFIATGLTNLAGGEVVTLWTTGTSPDLAAAIIDTSIVLFKEYAEGDTLSSQIKLTQDGLALQIQVLETRFLTVTKEEAGLKLQRRIARDDSVAVGILDQEFALELEKLGHRQEFYRKRIKGLQESRPLVEKDLAQIETALALVASNPDDGPDPESIPAWARRDAVLDGGDVMEGLADIRFRLHKQLNRNLAEQDSFNYELELATLGFSKLEIQRKASVELKVRELEQIIGDLSLELDYEIPLQRRELRNEINARQVQLGALTSLQRLGETIISDKPVRPRGARATLILVFLGVIGGIVLGFSAEYLLANRREIFRS